MLRRRLFWQADAGTYFGEGFRPENGPNAMNGVFLQSMLSKKSKIEQLPKSRESRFLTASAAASPCRTRTKLCGRLLVIRCGPSHWRARAAPAALKNLAHLPEKPFFDSIGQSGTNQHVRGGGSFPRKQPLRPRAGSPF
jgi:hypothetical protein